MSIISPQELQYWLAFNTLNQIGPVRFRKLLKHFESLEIAWRASVQDLSRAGFGNNLAELIKSEQKLISPSEQLELVNKKNIKITTIKDKNYPRLLQETYCCPPIIYYQGEIQNTAKPTIAVVGSRKNSNYGKSVTQTIISELIKNDFIVVSGLALGIDAIAHQECLDAGGVTFAVLGSGMDNISPVTNLALAKNIIKSGGAIMSEFAPGVKTLKQNFPRRNRIISGLSLGVLITEAAQKSGSLITARYALEQNRDVFAIPGPITQTSSQGTNELIQKGAQLVTCVDDILQALAIEQADTIRHLADPKPEIIFENQNEKIIYEILSTDPIHVDKLVQLSKLGISITSSTLSILELKGLVKNVSNNQYIKT